MGRKRKNSYSQSSPESSSELSSDSKYSSLQQSVCSSSSQSQSYDKLPKKYMRKLVLLEKKIRKEKKILQAQSRQRRAKKVKKRQGKKQIKSKQKGAKNKQVNAKRETADGKKLFITGINNKYSSEEVQIQLNNLLKYMSIQGVTDIKIIRRNGTSTYIFVDFQSKQMANIALEKLNNRKLFGLGIFVQFSQHQSHQNQNIKKCYCCNQYGHIARQCDQKSFFLNSKYKQKYFSIKNLNSKFGNFSQTQVEAKELSKNGNQQNTRIQKKSGQIKSNNYDSSK